MATNTPNLNLVKPDPNDYYNVSIFNANMEKIDTAIEEDRQSLENAVMFTAQSKTAAEQAQARGNIGAAPSGGGVMESAPSVESSSASESYAAFCAKLDAVLETMPDSSVKFLKVYPPQYYGYGRDMCALYKANNDYASVYTIGSYNINRQGFRMIKHKLYDSDPAGQWDPLEYINPNMQLGVEYRTTERYLGKPVYVKAVDFGVLPNKSEKSVTWGDATTLAFEVTARALKADSPSYTLPILDQLFVWAGGEKAYIKTTVDYSAWTGIATIKYTKTTD